jgi:hypothetical protein
VKLVSGSSDDEEGEDGNKFSKVLSILTLYNKYTRALTCEFVSGGGLMSLMGAYDDDDAAEDEGGAGGGGAEAESQGKGAVKEGEVKVGEKRGREEEEVEEEEEDRGPRKRKIRWLDETAGNIESYDAKRSKAIEAGMEAQKPSSSWALKLKEEQQAFAEAMASMKGLDDG